MCDMTHLYVRHDSFICVTWLIHRCGMTHSHVRQDSFLCVTWLIICVTWLIHMCDMTHSCVWHDSSIRVPWLIICVTWLIHTCAMTHYRYDTTRPHISHDSSIYLTCCSGPLSGGVRGSASPLCDMTHLHPWHDASAYLTRFIHMSHMTQWAVEWWSRGSAGPALFRFWGACSAGGADGHDCQLLQVLKFIWKCDIYTNATPYTWPIYVCVCIYTYIYTTQYVCIRISIQPNV